jgi:hypothetical protein
MEAEASPWRTGSVAVTPAVPPLGAGVGGIRALARVAVGLTTEALRRHHGRALAAERSEAAHNRAKRATDPRGKARGQRGRGSGRA